MPAQDRRAQKGRAGTVADVAVHIQAGTAQRHGPEQERLYLARRAARQQDPADVIQGGVPDEAVGLACASFMQSLWDTIKATPKDNLSFLMLDEAAEFMDGTLDLQKVFQQARKHNIGVIMANQEMDQMPKNLERTTLNNARNKIAFNTFSDDANTWRREMMIDAANFQNLPKHEAIVRLMTPAGFIVSVTIHTLKPDKERIKKSMADMLRQQSRDLYSTPLKQVQLDISGRREEILADCSAPPAAPAPPPHPSTTRSLRCSTRHAGRMTHQGRPAYLRPGAQRPLHAGKRQHPPGRAGD